MRLLQCRKVIMVKIWGTKATHCTMVLCYLCLIKVFYTNAVYNGSQRPSSLRLHTDGQNTVSSITEQMPLSITHLPENTPHPLRHHWLVYLPLAVLWQTDGRLTPRPSVLWSHWLSLWNKHHLIEAWLFQNKSVNELHGNSEWCLP